MMIQARWFRPLYAAAVLTAAQHCIASDGAAPLRYRPHVSAAGTIRICGDENMTLLARTWAEGFRRRQPGVEFEFKLAGTGAAMPCLYGTTGDLALFGREGDITDDNGFFKSVGGYKPLRLELMNGSLDVPGHSAAQVVFVHKDNPLSKLTVAQLDAVFGDEHRRGPTNIRTWGELGLTGAWRNQPIRLYGYDIDGEDGLHFMRTVLAESRKLNWDHLAEFNDGRKIVEALQIDRLGLAVSNLHFATAGVRPIAIAPHESAPYVLATTRSVIERTYPLGRKTYAFVNRRPGTELDPKLKEFLRYVLSAEGQRDIRHEHGYLPLSHQTLREQLRMLE